MPPVLNERSLDEVTTGYTLFEADQVLTHHQLNSVAGYADDQIRLSRVRLSGVGIACGLQVSLAGTTVRVTGGVGVTTDGDLLSLDGDTTFDRWRPYDASFPAYPPLYQGGDVNGTMHRAWELFAAGTPGSPGRPLGEFAGATGTALGTLAAVLLMESYRQDDDLCSGTDCDNLGARAVNTRKLLLVEPAALPALRGGQATAADAYAQLTEIGADRPVLGPIGVDNLTGLSNAYRAACDAIHGQLVTVLPRIFTHAGTALGPVVTAGSAAAWITRLTTAKNDFAGSRLGIQYYYDFLKDVVETYNELREQLFADDTWCTPPIATFPKHLLLGELTPSGGAADTRTGWYPSPVTSPTARALDHARFLVQRLDALVNRFSVSTDAALPVRVTPSMLEDRPLEDRAIPFYYTPGGADPVRRHWSWRLVRRGAADSTYSYYAPTYATAGSPAATPLDYQVARNTFFRVEGVVGKTVGVALEAVQAAIRDYNLPFAVRAVLVGAARASVHRQRGRRTDLHHLHQIVRTDTNARLADVETFNTSYSAQALAAADDVNVLLPNQTVERGILEQAGTTRRAEVSLHAGNALAITGGSYSEYLQGAGSLSAEIAGTIDAGTLLVHDAGIVLNTGYMTPVDTLGAGQAQWLPWIDEILVWQEEREDERYFFSNFVAEHPQVDHLGGVTRGGTLVLLHGEDGVVMGEVMLPYAWLEEPVVEEEPELETERAVPAVVATPPVRYVPTRELTWQQEWEIREPQIDVLTQARDDLNQWLQTETTRIQSQLDWQSQFIQQQNLDFVSQVGETYNAVLNNSWTYAGAKFTQTSTTTAAVQDVQVQYQDETLGLLAEATRKQAEAVTLLEKLAAGEDRTAQAQLDGARQTLAGLVGQTADYLGRTSTVLAPGTEGAFAFDQVTTGMTLLQGTQSFDAAASSVGKAAGSATNLSFKVAASPLLRG
ncbi:MAG TPA: hypothetical protein VF142_17245 [Longimicrobium sp.]